MRRFLSLELPRPEQSLALDANVSHHILRVTGIAPGEAITLFDGQGGVCEVVLNGVEAGRALVRWSGTGAAVVLPQRWLLMGLLKRSAFDSVIRMATELGVSAIWPVQLSRSVPQGGRLDRWERIAAAAAGQCGRTDIPEIQPARRLADCLAALPPGTVGRVYVPGAGRRTRCEGPAAALLGAEGGLTPSEIALAAEAGFLPAGLGSLTLRADTAAAAALSSL
ncbi:MAG: RsmE family RNA methyltransferase [Myxococcota bacterium]|nr:RsmE family RNA methyltransferase [Myxococcota bacterium]